MVQSVYGQGNAEGAGDLALEDGTNENGVSVTQQIIYDYFLTNFSRFLL